MISNPRKLLVAQFACWCIDFDHWMILIDRKLQADFVIIFQYQDHFELVLRWSSLEKNYKGEPFMGSD